MFLNNLFDVLNLTHLKMDDDGSPVEDAQGSKDSSTDTLTSNKTPIEKKLTNDEELQPNEQLTNQGNKKLLDQTDIENLGLKRCNANNLNGIADKEHFGGMRNPRKSQALDSVENSKGRSATDRTDHSKTQNEGMKSQVFESSKLNRPVHPPYIPPEIDESEENLFKVSKKGEHFEKLTNCKVEVSGQNIPEGPALSFKDANLIPKILENVAKLGFTALTPIQKWSIPIILNGRDMMASAQTGSGKTAAFLIPILSKLVHDEKLLRRCASEDICTPAVLIIAPTRELAHQIHLEAKKFSYETIIKSVSVYGGLNRTYQLDRLRGAAVIIGTVGRINDFIRCNKINLSALKFLVLDEADRMLEMGFHDDVFGIVAKCGGLINKNRQTLMFSATFPLEIQKLAYEILNDYVFVTVGMLGQANENIKQVILKVDTRHKKAKLTEVLNKIGGEKVIVFCHTKRNTDFLCISLGDLLDTKITAIHSDLSQMEREKAVGFLREGKVDILMATSIAARGLDIEGIKYVINYDLPKDINEYIHRIGRTARCGNTGEALSFFSFPEDEGLAKPLLKVLTETQQEVPRWLEDAALSRSSIQTYSSRTTDGRRDGRFPIRRHDTNSESNYKSSHNQPTDDDWI